MYSNTEKTAILNERAPLIAHIIHRLNVGGLENGLVNLINNLPHKEYRHAVICLTESSDFANRIRVDNVAIYELNKQEGKDFGVYLRLWKLLRRIKPDIVHTRNLSALEGSVVAALAGVPIRIHGEHGRDIFDLHGKNSKYIRLRRFCAHFIHRFIALSRDLEIWLRDEVRIPKEKIVQLYNGVDTGRFYPKRDDQQSWRSNHIPTKYTKGDTVIVGTVGRLEVVKDQLTLIKAFLELIRSQPQWRENVRLVLLGDGSLLPKIEDILKKTDTLDLVWLAGSRDDIPDILREFDIFVLPSLGEGISNTILEAMASGLPVVATKVGGNPELVGDGRTGILIPAGDPNSMAKAIQQYLDSPELRQQHGVRGRQRVNESFSLNTMINSYRQVYETELKVGERKKAINK